MPNLVICELSTTNLKHNFGYNSREHTMYIKKVFPEDFTYNDYNYITIHFIEYVKEHYHSDNNVTLNQIVNEYIKLFNMDEIMKNTLCDNLLSGGYSIEDIQNIGKS